MDGIFITFEGPDGAGKTSVIRALKSYLKEKLGDKVVFTREPGGNSISESIRDIIMDSKNTNMDSRTEALLFAAARRQHIVTKIQPALQSGKIIICDRYVDSSIAYQGAGRGIGEQNVLEMNQFAIDGLRPDLTIYLDIESEKGIERIKKNRQDEINRLDEEQLNFHKRVRRAYLSLQKKEPNRIKLVDASQKLDDVVSYVKKILNTQYPSVFTLD